jgi:hypothetical protein
VIAAPARFKKISDVLKISGKAAFFCIACEKLKAGGLRASL